MLDFRIMVGAIVICVSFVVIGLRLFLANDALDVALGERPDLATTAAPREPIAQSHAEEPLIPPVTLPRTASTRPPGGEITGSIATAGDARDPAARDASAEDEPPTRPAPRRRAAQRKNDDLNPLLMFFYRNSIPK